MKKLFSLLAVLLCVGMLATSAFAASADAYQIYSSAAKKMEKVTSAKARGTIKITMSSDLVSMDMKIGFTMLQRVDKDGKLEMSVILDSNDFGVESASYYRDGYLYSNADGVKTRIKMSQQDAMTEWSSDLLKDYFQDATVEDVEGGQRIKVKVPSRYLNELLGGTLGEITGQNLANTSAGFSNVSCTYTIGDNGYLKAQQMNYTMTLSGDISVKAKYVVNMKYSSFNKVTKIDFPSDLASYKTVS